MKRNWIKMYNKEGSVLRVETVINQPDEFKVRRRVRRQGRHVMAWVPLRKGVAFLPRYRQICAQTNARYLDALAHVDDPTPAIRALDVLTARASSKNGRTVRRSTRSHATIARSSRPCSGGLRRAWLIGWRLGPAFIPKPGHMKRPP